MTLKFIFPNLSWQVGNGLQIFPSIDPIVGLEKHYTLSPQIIIAIQGKNIFDLNNTFTSKDSHIPGWVTSVEINLDAKAAEEWDKYVTNLLSSGIYLIGLSDKLVWDQNKDADMVSAKLMYQLLANCFLKRDLVSTIRFI